MFKPLLFLLIFICYAYCKHVALVSLPFEANVKPLLFEAEELLRKHWTVTFVSFSEAKWVR